MRRVLIAAVALLLVAGVATGAYFLGRNSIDADAAYAGGYDAGERAGETQGHIAGFTDGQRSAMRTARITDRQTDRQHRREVAQAFNDGWNAVFEGFDSWAPGGYYIVQVDRGTDTGVSYDLKSRLEMRANETYSLCSDGTGICG